MEISDKKIAYIQQKVAYFAANVEACKISDFLLNIKNFNF